MRQENQTSALKTCETDDRYCFQSYDADCTVLVLIVVQVVICYAQWSKCKRRGGGTVIYSLGPLSAIAGP